MGITYPRKKSSHTSLTINKIKLKYNKMHQCPARLYPVCVRSKACCRWGSWTWGRLTSTCKFSEWLTMQPGFFAIFLFGQMKSHYSSQQITILWISNAQLQAHPIPYVSKVIKSPHLQISSLLQPPIPTFHYLGSQKLALPKYSGVNLRIFR